MTKLLIAKNGAVFFGRKRIGVLNSSVGPHGTSTGLFRCVTGTNPLTELARAQGVRLIWGKRSPDAGKPVAPWL